MKNLIALFSAKRVKVSINDFQDQVIGNDVLIKIRGGGQPVRNEEINILIKDWQFFLCLGDSDQIFVRERKLIF